MEHDQMFLYSQQSDANSYTQLVPTEGESKCRRRRKKNKVEKTTIEDIGFRKRKLSDEQVTLLELNFGNEHKLESDRKDRIALELGLDPRQVAVWFQNRRVRWKTKKIEEEYSELKRAHDGVMLEKCHLQSEVTRLKERLIEDEKQIQQLKERSIDHTSALSMGSPSSSCFTVEGGDPMFTADGFDNNFFYVPNGDNNINIHGMEWVQDLYGIM
ncbi:hypothetical protein MKX01_005746 [Papaver californicum]|nr:hypothetical protein MKX01_005746 [Papaver californicum]